MSWEAFRLTSKSPSELMAVMGPGGVDNLVREMLMACWRDLPEDARDLPAWRKRAGEVFDRNMRVWNAMKKPTPQAMFDHLLPYPADGFIRQALVLAHMMLPRGKRDVGDVRKFIAGVFDRNVTVWEGDFATFMRGVGARPRASATGKVAKSKSPPKAKAKRKKRK